MSFCKKCFLKNNPSANPEDLVFFEVEDKCECCGKTRLLVEKNETPEDYMSIFECRWETVQHQEKVREIIFYMISLLEKRAFTHDVSKLYEPEVSLFAEQNAKLKGLTYGSEEYKASLEALKPALDHHYREERHHPEHFKNGIADMNLIDVMEWICDCKASSLRQDNGNFLLSLEGLCAKFNIPKKSLLYSILENTVKMLDEAEHN